ncbi:MAG: hypothetical protein AB7G52_08280 [Arcobacter sp.]
MEHRDIPIKTKDEDKLNFSEFASKNSVHLQTIFTILAVDI